ncbi:CoxG family protein [Pseudorhodobacter sp.]|uniref:CoxG family protein n=1 Tax=Pseudorhodobacter sp. TaxID=1934400 RepID=UPI00264A25DD|nr:carbon monoxide dehydrogenase subunit G [Pseudorhodobacter sp.]MDN5788280.1 carbon monoxide dehydrogenase subunit G [Pseudorhodobacter sp.]
MQLNDQRDIKADVATVWAAILDADVLQACIPGCESLTGNPEDGFEAVVTQKVGPVKARFAGAVRLSELDAPRSLRMSGEGKGGAAGFAKGGARVVLTPSEVGTLLAYHVEANVGGKLAQLGSRIIDGFAKKLADDFFARLQKAVEGEDAADADAAPELKKKGWLKRLIS